MRLILFLLAAASLASAQPYKGSNAQRVGGKPAALPFESINNSGYDARYDPPSMIYPTGLPGSSNATPTIADCTVLVNALAKYMAHLTLTSSSAARVVYKLTNPASQASTQLYLTPAGALSTSSSGNLDIGASETTYSATEAVPVDIVNNTPALQKELAWRLSFQLAQAVDAAVVALYSGFTANSPVGTPGNVSVTTASLDLAITALAGNGEPIYLFIQPASLMATVATVASGAIKVPSFWGGSGGRYKTIRIVPCDQVTATGSAPATVNNLAITPSAIALVSEAQTTTNDATHAGALSTWTPMIDGAQPQLCVMISITNSGSGNQTVTVSVKARIKMVTGAKGIQVKG